MRWDLVLKTLEKNVFPDVAPQTLYTVRRYPEVYCTPAFLATTERPLMLGWEGFSEWTPSEPGGNVFRGQLVS